MPKVSIAMAVYNGEKYLRQQVESILDQTVKDFELVMTDDCSTDDSWSVMQSLAKEDGRIRVCRNITNLGFMRNFEKAISLCTADYVALSDCDDIWNPRHLEILMEIIGDNALACGDSAFIDAGGNFLGTTLRHQESLDWIPRDNMKKLLSIMLFRNPYQGATMLMKRSFLKVALPIPQNMRYHDTWFASLACFCGGINYTCQPLMKYRRLETSVTGLRGKRKSKLYRFLHVCFDDDRLDILNAVEDRLKGTLTSRQERTIEDVRKVFAWYNSHELAKVRLYELLHYKSIFSCDLTHWI